MRASRQRGFSVIELMVSNTVLMFLMLLALQMLGEAGRLQSSAQVEFAEPSLDLAMRWLRRDAQGASRLGRLSHLTTAEPLQLWGNVEGMIRYEKVGSNLERVILGMEGEEYGRRTVMRGVLEWHWRTLNMGLVEVELVYRHRVARNSTRRSGSPVEFMLVAEKRRFALRGLPRRYW